MKLECNLIQYSLGYLYIKLESILCNIVLGYLHMKLESNLMQYSVWVFENCMKSKYIFVKVILSSEYHKY